MKNIGFHILFWAVIVYWRANGDWIAKVPVAYHYWQHLIRLPIVMAATYLLIEYILPKFLIEEKKYGKFFVLFALNLYLSSKMDHWLIGQDWLYDLIGLTDWKQIKELSQQHPFRNSFYLVSIMGFASIIQFFQLLVKQERKERELIEENLNTRLAFLKSQVNPHFLFNALNNIYSMAIQKKQSEIAEGVENLSGIMYYLTYESSADFLPLEKELNLISNYIDIQQLRIDSSDETTISYNVEGDIVGKKIAPVILLPLVENAFKHGIKPDRKSLVSISVLIDKNKLLFKTTNTFFEKTGKEVKEHGVGLENVKKRLMLYSNRFELSQKQEGRYFYTTLQLMLNVE